MSPITGGELLARCLANEDIRLVFGLPCPEVDPLLASLGDHGIRFVPIRHEAAAVYMAMGVYKTTGKVAAVLGNPGPGSANLVPGVVTARHEGVPVVVITSQHRLDIVYPTPPSTFQGQDQLDMFRPIVKWGAPVLSWDRIIDVTQLAFREMWIGRPGPVHIEVPAPVLYESREADNLRIGPPSSYRAPGPQASAEQVNEAAEMLGAARKPMIFAGTGVERAQAAAELLEVVELMGCPVVVSMAGRGAVPLDHPNYLHGSSAGADAARQEADVILAAGSRLGNLDVPFDKYWGDPATQKLIQIDIDQRNLGVTRPLTLGIVSELKPALASLAVAFKAKGVKPQPPADLDRYRELSRTWKDGLFQGVEAWRGPGMHPAHAMQAVASVFGPDAVFATDGGNTSLWSHFFLPQTAPNSYLSILELGMLGTGIPSAIGAKLADPSREVICVTGDGAAGFHFMEMQSAARDNIKVVTIVFAEGAWTMEEPNELMRYGKTFGTSQGTIRWDQAAQGLGCDGFYAEGIEEVESVLEQARKSPRPAVVCLKTDKNANFALPVQLIQRFAEVYAGPM
jgi:acetolactate synthase-1/2/3 large subunit